MNFLDNCYRQRKQASISKDSFHCDHATVGRKKWVTASFTDPATSEVFSSGLGCMIQVAKKQGATMSTPLGAAEVCIIDGKVYYATERAAMHAAAARAIDCYLHREGSDEETKKYQLCLEDPYFDSTERDSQHKKYDELLRRRKDTLNAESDLAVELDPKTSVSFKSMATDYSFQLHAPMVFLENCYRQRKQGRISKDSFHCDYVTVDGKKWVTASFTDPATSEAFSSGLGRILNVAKKSGATLSTSLGEAEARIIDGKVYYTDPKLAIHAAAARVIDCYRYREETDNFPEKHQLCLEKPYLDIAEKNSQHNDYDELLRRRGEVVVTEKTQDWQRNATFTSEVKARPFKVHIPLSLLSLKGCIGENQFTTEEVMCEGRRWLTATFKDEKTGETFSSGLCKRTNVERKEGAFLSPSLEEVEKMIMDGKVYYPSLQLAKHAAAARAIDCYMFRETGKLPKFQICLETPHEEGYAHDVDYETLVSSMENVSLRRSSDFSNHQPADKDNDHDNLMEELHTPTDRENDHDYFPEDANTNNFLLEGIMPHLEEDDDNFHIVSPSFSDKPTKVDQKLSTLGRIAEIWAETSTSNRVNASADMENSKSASLYTSSPKDPTENIISWFKRVEHKPSNYEQAIAFRELCNKVLRALAKENSGKVIYPEISFTDCALGCSDIHNEAKNILDKIKSVSLQFSFADEPIVNADTLNAYIQCLSQTRAQNSANIAEELLKHMTEGKDRLPPPNTGTYNAVMKLWSMVEGDTGKHGVNTIFSLLEEAAGERGDIRPNRDTFQMLLSANSRENNNFKYDLAIESLQRIEELSEDLCGELCIPEVDDYSAALTKPTVHHFTKDDENYYPSWVWHGHQYDGGFKTMGDDNKCEALEMEKWLEYAEKMGTSPSEDMYLEVIKAWTNTGSLHGLVGFDGAHGAEELAKKAVQFSDGKPSVALFHPIIAAWSLCGENIGPDRVKDWIDQISSLGVKPDLDLRVAYFVAAEKFQSKLISKIINEGGEVASTDEDTESLFKAAQNCSRYLEEIILDRDRQDIHDLDAFTSILCHTMKAWSRASSTAVDTTQGVEEMAVVLKHISLRNSDRDPSDIDEAIVNAAGKVFTEFISQLGKLDASRRDHFDDSKTSVFADRIPDVESSLRSFEFHSRRLASIDQLSPESKMVRHNLYKETLRGCTGVKLSTDSGHVMRICALIMDCLFWHQNRSGGDRKDLEDITHIYSDIAIISGTCVENPYERMNVLTSIYDRASDFFPNKDSQDKNTSYACVDRATLLGSMRRAMGDSEMTDSFLSSFEVKKDGHNRRRPRQRQP